MNNPQPTHAVSVHGVTPNDYDGIAELLHDFRNTVRSNEYWQGKFAMWWDKNPFREDSIPRGWLLRAEGRIVGFISCIPILFQLAGKERLTLTVSSWYVTPEYRKNGLILFLSVLREGADTIIWNTTLNNLSGAIVERLHYQPIPYPFSQRILVFSSIFAWLHDVSIIRRWPIGLQWRLGSFHQWYVRIKLLLSQKYSSGPWQVKQLNQAGVAFDHLWQRTRTAFSTTRVRNATYVNWYCFSVPSKMKLLFGCFQGETLAGYAIFERRIVRGYPYLECLDLWVDSDIDQVGGVLFDGVMQWAARNEYRGLSSFDYPWVRSWLNRHRFKVVTPGDAGGLMKGPTELLQAILQGGYYFVLGEGDQGL
ncbi:MAG: GNAT family N-acetyltransferase [Magnetococcales bacterium]|nr:GNAT family N-acetyltransferase [Magnetococcales bacterium]MBF0148869.1 GNAT family N-acetyltransferase [Magnetococcales bacterium]MBF0174480.1 GNAT family N-acetyltransferase [Magnetococcales bacterium]MBF0630070.1 GNAT family N-acetyltransferase [Magnetococcales bacterium]